MTSTLKTVIAGILVLFLFTACSPSVKVRSDVAPDADLSRYESFSFFNPMGIEDDQYSNLLGQHFRDAVSQQMSARGFTPADSPQLRVNVSVGAKDKVRVNTYQEPYVYGGYYGYSGYGYYGSPWGYGGTRTTVHQYTEANVYLDVVDAGTHKLLWQGVATFTLTDKMQKQLRETVFSTVESIFEQFPVAAPGQ